jgi:hypothetical protein
MLPSYTIKYSNRKTFAIHISRTGELIASAPIGFPRQKIEEFIQSKFKRIITKMEQRKKEIPDYNVVVSREMKDQAMIQILPRIEYYADMMNVSYT